MFYRFIRRLVCILGNILYRLHITGTEHIPKEGAFILSGNHIHSYDAILLAIANKRQLYFMAKRELFERPFFGRFISKLGAFPVHRQGTDIKAYRITMAYLAEGKPVSIFSQGTRAAEFTNAKGGVAVFALKAQVPIIPVGISGSYKFFSKMHIKFGPPMSVEAYKGQKVKTELVDTVMNELITRIESLLV